MEKAFTGKVVIPGSAYNIQTNFEMEGVFAVRITPLGANLCLLEELEDGYLSYLIGERNVWWKQWFSDIHPWKASNVDDSRITWFRFYGIPCHPWCSNFCVLLANSVVVFVCVDEIKPAGSSMDIARIMVRILVDFTMMDTVQVLIDGEVFNLIMREDSYGPIRIRKDPKAASKASSSSSSVESWGTSKENTDFKIRDGSCEDLRFYGDEVGGNGCLPKEDGDVEAVGEGYEESNPISNGPFD